MKIIKTEQFIDWGKKNPKKLFQIDGIGALLSALLLGIVMVKLEGVFGIPKSTLYFLAVWPCLFAGYDIFCYFKADERFGTFLTGIAIANLLYCCLSIGLAIYHINSITILGWIYILIEILIIAALSWIELRVAKK